MGSESGHLGHLRVNFRESRQHGELSLAIERTAPVGAFHPSLVSASIYSGRAALPDINLGHLRAFCAGSGHIPLCFCPTDTSRAYAEIVLIHFLSPTFHYVLVGTISIYTFLAPMKTHIKIFLLTTSRTNMKAITIVTLESSSDFPRILARNAEFLFSVSRRH